MADSGVDSALTAVQKLLVSGCVCLSDGEGVVLRRLMVVETADGHAAGLVAAVVVDGNSQVVTHFLLGSNPPTADYRVVALSQIAGIEQDRVRLRVTRAELQNLPVHSSQVSAGRGGRSTPQGDKGQQ